MLAEPVQERRAHTTTAVAGQDARRDEPETGEVRAVGETAAGDDVVELGEEHEAIGRLDRAHALDRPRRLIGDDDLLDVEPGLELLVALCLADRDHPLRFSFPWRFAYISPRLKTHRPSGIETAPITSSGQISSHMRPAPSPPMMASRMPSSA